MISFQTGGHARTVGHNMPATTRSGTLFGLQFTLVTVEVDIQNGLPRFVLIGLPDASVQEARDRVTSALKNSGFGFPKTHVLANLAPADVKKEGPSFDLALAIGVLSANGLIPPDATRNAVLFGELALDGSLRPVAGIIPLLLGAKRAGVATVIVPEADAQHAALCPDMEILIASHLREVVAYFNKDQPLRRAPLAAQGPTMPTPHAVDFRDIVGQRQAKRGLEIAAAGGHNVLFLGPPGSGKTLLARALPGILPPLTDEEHLEVAMIQSLSETAHPEPTRPFRAPHHAISGAALLIGKKLKPGEVTLAHRGVLFLDEFPEFRRDAIENLRQPLEEGFITLSRTVGSIKYPARFQLIAAMNPCPCGFAGDGSNRCECPMARLLAYAKKISGPIKDRIDLHIRLPRIHANELLRAAPEESSATIRSRVIAARERMSKRYAGMGFTTNAELHRSTHAIYLQLPDEANALYENAIDRLRLSARAADRVLKVARTIADLAGSESISASHIAEALQFRESV